jgi:hypothetical protein
MQPSGQDLFLAGGLHDLVSVQSQDRTNSHEPNYPFLGLLGFGHIPKRGAFSECGPTIRPDTATAVFHTLAVHP